MSVPRPSAANTAQGNLGVRSATSRAEAQIPASGGSRTRDAGVQVELQELEETAERESAGCSPGKLWSASLASPDEAGSMPSASLLAADPGPGGHLEALAVTGPEDGEHSTSSKAEYFPEEANAAPFFWRACEGEEETATTMPEFSNQSLGEEQRLQDPREVYGEAYGYPPVHPAIQRIRDEAKKDQMLPHWNISWPNSMSVPPLLRPQATEDSASAADSAQDTLSVCSVTSRAEGQFSASDDSSARGVIVQDSQLELEEAAEIETAGQSSGTLQVASLAPSDEVHAVCSPSLLDAEPGPAGHLEPLPVSVLEDAESSDSSEAASSAEETDAVSLPLPMSKGGEREESAMAMPESSGQGLGEARRLPDPSEINREPSGYSPMIPAMRRIREEDRNEQMLSHWNISWPRNVRSPRQRRLQARGDAFNNVGARQGMPGIWPTTSRAGNWFLDSGDSRKWTVRLPVILEESSDDSDSAASTAEGTLDARDNAVRDEGMHPPSCPCPSTLENVEEDWGCDSEEDAASEAVSITSSTSDEPSGEVEAISSASSVAADPMTEEHVSACEGAEDVGPQHEVSKVSTRHELEAEAGVVPGVCAVGRCLEMLSPFQPAPCIRVDSPSVIPALPSIKGAWKGDPSPGPLAPTPSPASGIQVCGFVLFTQVSAEAEERAQSSVCFRDAPEDGPGTSPDRKQSQGGTCQAQMAHQVAWRLTAFHALPYPGQSSQGNSMVVGGTARHLPRGDQECPSWIRAPQVSHCKGLGIPYIDIIIPPYEDIISIQINPDTVVQRELLQLLCLCSKRQSGRVSVPLG